MIPYLGTPAPRKHDGVKCGTTKLWSALGSQSGNAYDYDVYALADHFGTLMKSDMPPSLEVLLRPLPPSLRRSLHFEHSIEGILPILSDDNAVQLHGFVLDYMKSLLCLEVDLVELLQKQEALLYFLVMYTAQVQDRAGRHGLRITRPLFDGQVGAGQGVAVMKHQWAAMEATETTGSAPAGGPNGKGLRLPFADAPTRVSPVTFLALELVDIACKVADRVRADRLSRTPSLRAPEGLTTLLFLMDDVRFAHTMLAASAAGSEGAAAVALRLERVKHWQRTWVDDRLGPVAGGTEGTAYTAMDKCCLVLGLLLLGLLLLMCVEVGVVEVQPADFGARLQGESLN